MLSVHCRVASRGAILFTFWGSPPSPGACHSIIQLPRPPSVGPGRGAQPWWWGAEGARSVWRGGSHLRDSALPTRRARRKSHPGPRAPPAPAPPWPHRSAGSTPPLPPPPPPPAPSSAAGRPPGGAPRLRSARRAGGPEKPRPRAPLHLLQTRGSAPSRGVSVRGGRPLGVCQRPPCSSPAAFLTEGGLPAKPEIL